MTTLEKIRAEIDCYLKNNEFGTEYRNDIKNILDKYAEQEPCDDVVSREAVYRLVNDLIVNLCENGIDLGALERWGREQVMELPSVTQEQTGHWIIIDDCEKFIAKCSECGQIEDSRMIGKYAYCHCGAKMVKPQERGNKE